MHPHYLREIANSQNVDVTQTREIMTREALAALDSTTPKHAWLALAARSLRAMRPWEGRTTVAQHVMYLSGDIAEKHDSL